ncbi:M48 family metalloprotease [Roseibium aggregatum]|uniref:M48 family metalloprotease n=1 Tax=Roseibium aggregatum TaxID=187304 RepID=UPI0025AD2E9B|nr:M48 family metalloprotease [Roseibium aggregatum]WJS05494.1 M48 family metalloprotease [Roseibium aggregatum]
MKPIFRVAVIEVTRLLALVAGATSAFLLTAFSISLLNIPYSLIYGPLPFEEWQVTAFAVAIAVAPAVFVAYVPSFAASGFDIRLSARRLSQREKNLVAKVEEVLLARAEETGIKLPQIVWRVQDIGEINALAYAHNRVCFTKGILHKYGDTQAGIERLAGVAAHEVGHLRNWDTRINMFLHYLNLPVNFGIGLANATINRIPIAGLIFTVATVLFRIPCDIAYFLNESTSQLREYQADRFAARLMNGVGISEFLDELTHQDDRQGDRFSAWMMRSHPPTELRHDELAKVSK